MAQTPDKPSLPNSASATNVNPSAKPVAPTGAGVPAEMSKSPPAQNLTGRPMLQEEIVAAKEQARLETLRPDPENSLAAKTAKEIAEGRRPDPSDAPAGAKALAGTGSVSNPGAAVPGLNPPASPRHEYRDTARSPLPGLAPVTPALPSAGEFQSHLSGWLAEVKAELPSSTQQHPVDYLEANFDRLSLQLYRRMTGELKGGQDAR